VNNNIITQLSDEPRLQCIQAVVKVGRWWTVFVVSTSKTAAQVVAALRFKWMICMIIL